MENIIKSIYSLINSNKGFFKSDKQAGFLLKVTGGAVFQDFSFSLGSDYNDKKAGVGAQRVFTLDNQGVVSVVDVRAKGDTIVFKRNGINLIKEKTDKKKAIHNKAEELKNEIASTIKSIHTKALEELKTLADNGSIPLTNEMLDYIAKSIEGTSKVNDFISNPLLSDEIHNLGKRLAELKNEFNHL